MRQQLGTLSIYCVAWGFSGMTTVKWPVSARPSDPCGESRTPDVTYPEQLSQWKTSVGSTPGQRRRRWFGVDPTLDQRPIPTGRQLLRLCGNPSSHWLSCRSNPGLAMNRMPPSSAFPGLPSPLPSISDGCPTLDFTGRTAGFVAVVPRRRQKPPDLSAF